MLDPVDKARLDALQKRIAEAKGPEEASKVGENLSQAQLGWQMVIELVAGLLIGFAIGYGLDRLFGTLPVFLVIFTLLGFAAGVRVMMKTAAQFGMAGAAKAQDAAKVAKGKGN
jgi:ATP synthase protein I